MIFGATYNFSGTILISHKTPGLSLKVSHNNEINHLLLKIKLKTRYAGLYEITGTPDSSVMLVITYLHNFVGTACNPITLPAGNIKLKLLLQFLELQL